MSPVKTVWGITLILIISYASLSSAVPAGSDPAAAADPSLSTSSGPGPADASAPAVTAPAPENVPQANPVAPTQPNGIITEHKNPDGSTITVTRFNGPLPSNAFQGDAFRLHDVLLQSNLYQTQLLQLQTQQMINQALLRNMQFMNYPNYAGYSPYTYQGQFMNPFVPFGFGGYPFFSYPNGPAPARNAVK